MHTQRQSYLFKNRSRSPQFTQAMQREKSHQNSYKDQPLSLHLKKKKNFFLSSPGNSPFISFSLSNSVSLYPCCCETNKYLSGVFQQKLIWSALFSSSPSSLNPSLIRLHISHLIISSILIVLMSVFLRIMYRYCTAGS